MAKRELIFKDDGQGESNRTGRLARSLQCGAKAGFPIRGGVEEVPACQRGVLSARWARVVEARERGTCGIGDGERTWER